MSFFQALMPLIGWIAGSGLEHYIEKLDHWIAFIMLTAIGGKMIFEGITNKGVDKCFCPTKNWVLLGMALATSIDALIVGVGFGILNMPIILPVIVIGIVTLIFSFIGVYLGHKIGNRYNAGLEIIGGLLLFGLGLKILLEHTLLLTT